MDGILYERSEILSGFNEEEIAHLLDEQITSDFEDLASMRIDYFKPLYLRYKNIMDVEIDSDVKKELETKFTDISLLFIRRISKIFNLKVSEGWADDHFQDIPCLALALYDLFVLEVMQNIEDVLHSFILKNQKMLYDIFEEQKNKRDGSTLVYQKRLAPEMAVIIANIYNVTSFSINSITEDEFFENLPEGYVPGDVVKVLYSNGIITGSFMDVIRDIYLKSSYLRSIVCFNIESSYRGKPVDKEAKAEAK